MALEKSALEYDKYKDLQKQIQHEESLKELEADIHKINPRGSEAPIVGAPENRNSVEKGYEVTSAFDQQQAEQPPTKDMTPWA